MTDNPHELSRILITRFDNVIDGAKGWKPGSRNESPLFIGTLMKLWQHGLSALALCEQPYSNKSPEHRDYASLSVIARASLESAGIFKYIFYVIHPDDKWFLLDYMEMCGLMIRATFEVASDDNAAKLEFERRRIEELQTILPTHKLYGELPDNEQKRVLRGTWKPFNKSELPEILGLGPKSVQTTYSFLSDYVHNGYLATLQITQPEGSLRLAQAALVPVSVSLAFTAQTLSETFEGVRSYTESDPDFQQAVEVFVRFGQT